MQGHRRPSSQRFEHANYIDWYGTVNFAPAASSPDLPKVFDAVYGSKHKGYLEIRRLRLKSRFVDAARREFNRIAQKQGYKKISLLEARPDGKWSEWYQKEIT